MCDIDTKKMKATGMWPISRINTQRGNTCYRKLFGNGFRTILRFSNTATTKASTREFSNYLLDNNKSLSPWIAVSDGWYGDVMFGFTKEEDALIARMFFDGQ